MNNDYTLNLKQTVASGKPAPDAQAPVQTLTPVPRSAPAPKMTPMTAAAGGKGTGLGTRLGTRLGTGLGTGPGTGDGAGEGDAGMADWKGVDVMPAFPGGEAGLRRFLERRLQTPDELETGIRVRFVVKKDGRISACTVDKSGGTAFDTEVLRVVREMPKWKPGIQNGRPVAVYFVLPVTFMRGED